MDSQLHIGEMTVVGRLVDASNATLLCEIGSDDSTFQVIYKPIAGERALWDFPEGELAKREVAAYLVSEALSLKIVPETIFREGPFGLGSVQRWIEIDQSIDIVPLAQSDHISIRNMALLDVLINNTDRKFGHILPTVEGEIFGCDHGVTFHSEDKLRTVLWQFAGEAMTVDEISIIQNFIAHLDEFGLAEYLSEEDIAALKNRALRLIDDGSFPFPSQEWPAVPWPPF